jgi:hypothetical protein
MTAPLRFFLAGIMQGSHLGAVLHNQTYRERIRELLTQAFPGCSVYDPLADHQMSLDYDDGTAREVFYHHNRMCREVDVVVAFVPEATMGTAIEIWEARRCGRVVIAISPLLKNWAVKYCSHHIYPDAESFEAAARSGQLANIIAEAQKNACPID